MTMLSATTLIIVLYKTARAAPAGSSNELATSNVASIDPLPDTYDYDESEYYGGASNKPTSGGNDDGDCTDIWSAGKCREKADAGKCNKPNAVLKCKATCGLCSYPPPAPPSLTCNDLAACNKYSSPRPSPPPSSSVSSCESDIIDSYGNCVPATCETWFDGCNNCGVMLNGLLHCTKKFCMIRQEEKCTEYTSSSVLVSLWYVYERFCS